MKVIFASSVSYEENGFLQVVALGKNGKQPLYFRISQSYILVIADNCPASESQERLGFQ